jgi:putative endonuclease
MFFVYILKSKINGAYYIGSCEDISIRFSQHNKGLVKSTKRYLPWDLVYREGFNMLTKARKRELQIKSWKSRRAVERIITF